MIRSIEDLPPMITPAQLAECTGEHVGSIRRGIREQRLPAQKINGRWYIYRDLVFTYLTALKGDGQHGQLDLCPGGD